MNCYKIDKSAFASCDLHDGGDEKAYWLSKSPQGRLQAIEIMMRIIYGDAAITQRLQKFFEITELKK